MPQKGSGYSWEASQSKVDETAVIKFPGVFVFLTPGDPSGDSDGTVVNHGGLNVPNGMEFIAKLEAAGVKMDPKDPATGSAKGLPVGTRPHATFRDSSARKPPSARNDRLCSGSQPHVCPFPPASASRTDRRLTVSLAAEFAKSRSESGFSPRYAR